MGSCQYRAIGGLSRGRHETGSAGGLLSSGNRIEQVLESFWKSETPVKQWEKVTDSTIFGLQSVGRLLRSGNKGEKS